MVPKNEEKEEKRESLLTPADCRKSLQVELRRIRSLVKEIAANYAAKLESRAEATARVLDEIELDPKEDFRRLIKNVRDLTVKPNKGRRKDLRQLEELIDKLRVDIDTIREKQEKQGK